MDIVSFMKNMSPNTVTFSWGDNEQDLYLIMKAEEQIVNKFRQGSLAESAEVIEKNGEKHIQFLFGPINDDVGISFNIPVIQYENRLNNLKDGIGNIEFCYTTNDNKFLAKRGIMEKNRLVLQLAMNTI